MKKLLLLVATLITLSAKSQTSVYHPFPEDSATWCASMCGLHLYQGYPNSMIEGIGPTHGFFYEANVGYDHVQALGLFTQNNQIFYPYYSPDTIGMWQYCYDFTAGIEEPNQIAYSISPNPSPGKFTIRFAQYLSKVSIEIYSSIGEKVWNENICNESKKEIKLNNISSGIYFVKVFDGERSYCKKLIIEHD